MTKEEEREMKRHIKKAKKELRANYLFETSGKKPKEELAKKERMLSRLEEEFNDLGHLEILDD